MREENGAPAVTAEHPATPKVAPRFTRAAQAEPSRLEGKREQLLRKREAAQAEVAQIDRAVSEVDELIELLAPLLTANGSESAAAGEDAGTDAQLQPQPSKQGER
jgi:hypothetical protein